VEKGKKVRAPQGSRGCKIPMGERGGSAKRDGHWGNQNAKDRGKTGTKKGVGKKVKGRGTISLKLGEKKGRWNQKKGVKLDILPSRHGLQGDL